MDNSDAGVKSARLARVGSLPDPEGPYLSGGGTNTNEIDHGLPIEASTDGAPLAIT